MRDLMIFLGFAGIPVSATLIGLWLSAKGRAERSEGLVNEMIRAGFRPPERMLNDRLAERPSLDGNRRMEDAINSIALEVERISEAQRFTTRLLSEHRDVPVNQAPRVVTPH